MLVTIDGVRWQEVFGGADESLLDKKEGVADLKSIRARFWRETPEERREVLLPFVWGTMAREGVLFGNAGKGGEVRVSNAFKVSYPGYHEILSGFASPDIKGNAPVWNPDLTVLEWLQGRPGFHGRVEAWCSWERFPHILNRERAGFPIFAGEAAEPPTAFDRLMADIPADWKGGVLDAFVFQKALEAIRARKPRVMYLALGDTDEWAHAGRYDRYLESLRRSDAWLESLWGALQALPEYRGRTSLLVTTDHGRGTGPDWRHHNAKHAEAGRIWVAAMGPRVAPLGEAAAPGPLIQAQMAATVAALLGEDFAAAVPQAAPPFPLIR